MAETMKFDLVSPERRLVSGQAKSVQIPGADGDMTAMPDHAPTITTLRPGILTVELTDGVKEFAVTGGFAEITADGTSVLAENAYPRSGEHRDTIAAHLEEARAAHASAPAETKDGAEKTVNDLVALLNAMA
jgi:F-type H+-transporting ATPase subunit epsilon